ncbi:MAG: AI-2E family transporter [Peptoniphilaceae bacterium]|nr:AI-2E family transporter [Peptoniphilaceae bacterium]MDY6085736.1 AI-2E family transporter [Peptoniphilaceae bacterium]
MKLTPEQKNTIQVGTRIAAFAIVFAYLVYNVPVLWKMLMTLIGIIQPFLVGLGIAFLVNMPMRVIEGLLMKMHLKRSQARPIAMILALLFILGFVIFTFGIIMPRVIDSVMSFVRLVPNALSDARTWIHDAQWLGNYRQPINDFIDQLMMNINTMTFQQFIDTYFQQIDLKAILQQFASNIFTRVGSIFGVIVTSLAAFIFTIYILMGKERLSRSMKKFVYTFLSEKRADTVMYVSYTAFDNFYNFFTGQFLEAILLGVMNYAGMTILGLQYALVISLLTMIGALIPLVGAFLAGLFGALMLITISPIDAACYMLYITLLQQLEGNIVYPRVVGSQTGMPGMVVMLSVIVGAALMGFAGMFLFVPLTATFYTIINDYMNRTIAEKHLRLEAK